MNITAQQQRCVEAVAKLCGLTGRAVGCTDVARELGVSKVTTFEHLRTLAQRKHLRAVQIKRGWTRYEPVGDWKRFEVDAPGQTLIKVAVERLRKHGDADLADQLLKVAAKRPRASRETILPAETEGADDPELPAARADADAAEQRLADPDGAPAHEREGEGQEARPCSLRQGGESPKRRAV